MSDFKFQPSQAALQQIISKCNLNLENSIKFKLYEKASESYFKEQKTRNHSFERKPESSFITKQLESDSSLAPASVIDSVPQSSPKPKTNELLNIALKKISNDELKLGSSKKGALTSIQKARLAVQFCKMKSNPYQFPEYIRHLSPGPETKEGKKVIAQYDKANEQIDLINRLSRPKTGASEWSNKMRSK